MKKIIALLLVLVMVVALAACGAAKTEEKEEETKKEETKKEETKEEEPAADDGAAAPAEYTGSEGFDWGAYEGCTIEIMWPETDSTQIDIKENFAEPNLQAISDEFGVTFDWVSTLGNNITTLAATGDMPDIWFGTLTRELIDSDVVLDLTPYVTVDTYLEDHFTTPESVYFMDHVWGLTSGVDSFYTGTLYYNQDLFNELGITDITTRDGLMDAMAKIKEAGKIPFVASQQQAFTWENMLVARDPNAYKKILAGDADAMTDPAVLQSLADYREIVDKGFGYPGWNTYTDDTANTIAAFAAGDLAMCYHASWNNGTVLSEVGDAFEVGVAFMPTANPDYAYLENQAGWGSALNCWAGWADTEYPEAVVETLKVIMASEADRHLAAGLGTNHVQTAAPEPANELEAKRLDLYYQVKNWLGCWYQMAADGNMQLTWKEQLEYLLSDDDVKPEDVLAEMTSAWESNTFFG